MKKYHIPIIIVCTLIAIVLIVAGKNSYIGHAIQACLGSGGSFDMSTHVCTPGGISAANPPGGATGPAKSPSEAGPAVSTGKITYAQSKIIYSPPSAANLMHVTEPFAGAV
ncbi:MAG: hypothetical protein QOG91_533, partial [Candidatus Parcubacteria bacterium]|nr:hypothetical protein [Candidatus Parcubacteria bacterium]